MRARRAGEPPDLLRRAGERNPSKQKERFHPGNQADY